MTILTGTEEKVINAFSNIEDPSGKIYLQSLVNSYDLQRKYLFEAISSLGEKRIITIDSDSVEDDEYIKLTPVKGMLLLGDILERDINARTERLRIRREPKSDTLISNFMGETVIHKYDDWNSIIPIISYINEMAYTQYKKWDDNYTKHFIKIDMALRSLDFDEVKKRVVSFINWANTKFVES